MKNKFDAEVYVVTGGTEFVCPSCGIKHVVSDMDPEDYDGLCPECEKGWVEAYKEWCR